MWCFDIAISSEQFKVCLDDRLIRKSYGDSWDVFCRLNKYCPQEESMDCRCKQCFVYAFVSQTNKSLQV